MRTSTVQGCAFRKLFSLVIQLFFCSRFLRLLLLFSSFLLWSICLCTVTCPGVFICLLVPFALIPCQTVVKTLLAASILLYSFTCSRVYSFYLYLFSLFLSSKTCWRLLLQLLALVSPFVFQNLSFIPLFSCYCTVPPL